MSDVPSNQAPLSAVEDQDDEISLFDLAIVLAKHKKLLIGFPALAAAVAIGFSLSLPNVYTGTTRILPPQQGGQSTAAAMLSQLGGLAGGSAGLKNPNDMYIGMLKSRTVADSMIQRFDLMKYYGAKYQSGARTSLEAQTKIAAGKDGIITINVDDVDPKRAADMANAYVDELMKLTRVLAVTEASQRRLFFERQLEQARDNLARTEISARRAMEQGGLANVDAHGKAILETTARLRGQIAVKEVQIGAMRSFAADRNPDLLMAQGELATLKSELAKIEGGSRSTVEPAESGGLGNIQLLRNVKYYETMYEFLAKQYEIAKIDEAKESAVIQVMDKAIEPDRKSGPKRAQIVLNYTLAAFFMAVLAAFVKEAMAKARENPESAQRMATFKSYMRWRQ